MSVVIPTLTCERLTLRALSTADVDGLHRMMQDILALRYFPTTQPPSRERVRSIIGKQLDHWRHHGYGWWAVDELSSGAFMGWCGLQFLPETREVEVAYHLDRAFWGRGLATEAATAAVRYGFEQIGLETIIAVVHPDNRASQRVIEKLGMAFLGEAVYFGMEVLRYSMSHPRPADASVAASARPSEGETVP